MCKIGDCKIRCCLNKKKKKNHVMLTVFSVLLCVTAVASTAAYILSKIAIKKAHEEKWKDYDECGLL